MMQPTITRYSTLVVPFSETKNRLIVFIDSASQLAREERRGGRNTSKGSVVRNSRESTSSRQISESNDPRGHRSSLANQDPRCRRRRRALAKRGRQHSGVLRQADGAPANRDSHKAGIAGQCEGGGIPEGTTDVNTCLGNIPD